MLRALSKLWETASKSPETMRLTSYSDEKILILPNGLSSHIT